MVRFLFLNLSSITKIFQACLQMQNQLDLLPDEGQIDFHNVALPHMDEAFQQPERRLWMEDEGSSDTVQVSSNNARHQQARSLGKRKKACSTEDKQNDNPIYYSLLRTEQQKLESPLVRDDTNLEKYLEHPHIEEISKNLVHVMQLRFLYLAIGGFGTLNDFKEHLCVARQRELSYSRDSRTALSLMERFSEICRLESEEVLCTPIRLHHVIKFWEAEQEAFRQNNWMVIENSSPFEMVHKPQRGNPDVIRKAAATATLASRIKPGLSQESKEFKRLCDKIKRLRRLAQNLQMLTKIYGFGILALLPLGPSHQDLSLTDTMLVFSKECRIGLS
jgi:hypothetical protein